MICFILRREETIVIIKVFLTRPHFSCQHSQDVRKKARKIKTIILVRIWCMVMSYLDDVDNVSSSPWECLYVYIQSIIVIDAPRGSFFFFFVLYLCCDPFNSIDQFQRFEVYKHTYLIHLAFIIFFLYIHTSSCIVLF